MYKTAALAIAEPETYQPIKVDPLSIMIVDDSSSERRLLSAILERFGHDIHEIGSGEEAESLVKDANTNIDLILLDVNMPDIDGYQTASRIRRLETQLGIEWQPIIFLSGRNSPSDIAMGIEAGGDDFIIKPVNSITLQAKIHAMSRISKMRKRLINVSKKLEMQAHFDELTGIANRRHFISMLEKEIARSHRHALPLSLAFFDVDKFKNVNDTYGHKIGDDVLKGIAQKLSDSLRQEDVIGRLGGEEFCIYFPGQTLQTTQRIIERYRVMINEIPFSAKQGDFHVSASFGISELTRDDDVNHLLEKADQLLYKAKNNGRNRIET